MLTAVDSAVFIRWLRLQVTPDPDSGHQNCIMEVLVNVAGELAFTFTTFVSTTPSNITDDMDTALELRRQDFVSA